LKFLSIVVANKTGLKNLNPQATSLFAMSNCNPFYLQLDWCVVVVASQLDPHVVIFANGG